jgi:hydroxymethylpyrimidine pyrophosphatase-like HAD family hydrolase
MSSADKAIFVDMGGTLLTNEGKPYEVDGTDLNVKVLRELVATGIPFNMLTGLPPELLRKAVLEPYLKLATYVVLENGAAIYRRKGATLGFGFDHLDTDWHEKIRKASEGLDSIVDVLSRENVAHQRFDYSVRVYDAKTQLAEGRAQELLSNLPEAIQVRLYRADMIFCPVLANKGEALRFIAAKECWKLSSIMAIGNEMIDESMLKIVGHPRATHNSPSELKQLVDKLGGEVSESPAGEAVYEFLLSVLNRKLPV